MEGVMDMLRKIKLELDEQKNTILKSGIEVTEKVTGNVNKILEEKFKIMEQRYDKLNERVENQEKRLYYLEKDARQRNIVIFGLEESESSYSELENNIIVFIKNYLAIDLEYGDIQAARRIGRKGDRTRPITITLLTLGRKIDIYKRKGALKDTPYYLKEDYPPNILEKRRELQEQVKLENEKGNTAIIKYDKIVILKNNPTINNNKRARSLSPGNNTQQTKKTNANKKNKALPTQTHMKSQRTATTIDGVIKPGLFNYFNKVTSVETNTQE